MEDYFYGRRGPPESKDRIRAARLLAEFFSEESPLYLVKLLVAAEPEQFREIFARLSGRHAGEQLKIEQALMGYIQQPDSTLADAANSPISRVNAAIAWMQFHAADLANLQHAVGTDNPISVRRLFIHRAHDCLADEFDGSFDRFWTGTDNDTLQSALMLAIAQHDQRSMLDESQRKTASHLGKLYTGGSGLQVQRSAAVHAAAWYFLQRWFGEVELDPTGGFPDVSGTIRIIQTDRFLPRQQMSVAVQDVIESTLQQQVDAGWNWFRVAFETEDSSQIIRHSMSVIRSSEVSHPDFAISLTEVTRAQYLGLFPEYCANCGGIWDSYRSESRSPMAFVSLFDAAAYCNRLSACAGLDRNEWCYEFWKDGVEITTDVTTQIIQSMDGRTGAPSWDEVTLKLADDWTRRIGYRLPTMSEWNVARGESFQDVTSLPLLKDYAWYDIPAANVPQDSRMPRGVGLKMPNQFGLFDMLGNVAELCHPDANESTEAVYKAILSGGSAATRSNEIESPRMDFDATTRDRFVGFRIVRTLRSE